jgi:hypothetical protein
MNSKTYRRSITKLVFLASKNLSQNSPHNLSTSSLGQIWHNEDSLRSSEGTNALPDLQDEVLLELIVDLIAVLDSHERVDCLSSKLIVDSDDSSFCDGVILNQCGFDFGSGETVTADVDNVIDTASDPVVTFVVTSSSITSELQRI